MRRLAPHALLGLAARSRCAAASLARINERASSALMMKFTREMFAPRT